MDKAQEKKLYYAGEEYLDLMVKLQRTALSVGHIEWMRDYGALLLNEKDQMLRGFREVFVNIYHDHLVDENGPKDGYFDKLSEKDQRALRIEVAESDKRLLSFVEKQLIYQNFMYEDKKHCLSYSKEENFRFMYENMQEEFKKVIVDIARHITKDKYPGKDYFILDGQRITYDSYLNKRTGTALYQDPITKALLEDAKTCVQDRGRDLLYEK